MLSLCPAAIHTSLWNPALPVSSSTHTPATPNPALSLRLQRPRSARYLPPRVLKESVSNQPPNCKLAMAGLIQNPDNLQEGNGKSTVSFSFFCRWGMRVSSPCHVLLLTTFYCFYAQGVVLSLFFPFMVTLQPCSHQPDSDTIERERERNDAVFSTLVRAPRFSSCASQEQVVCLQSTNTTAVVFQMGEQKDHRITEHLGLE